MHIAFAILITIALVAIVPEAAHAQTEAGSNPAFTGTLDFGARGTTTSGDAARYERYRDLGDGLFLETLRLNAERNGWYVTAGADHAGRRDQRFSGQVERPGRLKLWAVWDQIPMLMSRTTRTLFVEDVEDPQGALTMDNAVQTQAQAAPAAMVGLFQQLASQFDTRSRRDAATAGFEYLATDALSVQSNVQVTRRNGTLPYGGNFGHSSLVELPAPIDHTLTDFTGGAEFARDPILLRAGYVGSWFQNDFTTLTFDNPFRAVDSAATSSRGRLSLAPTNSFVSVNGLASVKLPQRSRATAYVSVGSLNDNDDPLMAQTINSATVTAPLERTRVEGEARTTAFNLSFVSRPTRQFDVDVRYRGYDYDNRTPEFALTQRVSYDNTPSNLAAPVHTEPFSLARHSFDADLRYSPVVRAVAGVGFTRQAEDRTHRIFESITDNVFRLTFDSIGNQWFSVRTKYEHARKRGDDFDVTLLTSVNEQPGMRHFDVASRDRNRVTVVGSVTPVSNLGLTASVAAGKDDYLESEFGLRDNVHRVYSFGIDGTPAANVVWGGSYSYENYNALSRSRQASSAAEFVDPARNWASDATDRVHSVVLNAGVNRIASRFDLGFTYDFNRAHSTYDYITGAVANRTLPEEVVVPTALPLPSALPRVQSEVHRSTIDVTWPITSRIALGLSHWYERFRVQDFTLDIENTPTLVLGQSILMGYLYRPYDANTFWARLVYRW
jgi:MtrB/PioB family decaheme-associated outer membrane protein